MLDYCIDATNVPDQTVVHLAIQTVTNEESLRAAGHACRGLRTELCNTVYVADEDSAGVA